MSSLWFIAGAAGVASILLSTEGIPSRQLASELGVHVPDFFCKAGNGPEDGLFRIGAENFYAIVATALLFTFITTRYIRYVPLRVVAVTAIIYSLAVAIIGFMRYSDVPQINSICEGLATRTQNTLHTEANDLIVPFLHPLRYLPDKPFADDFAMRTYAVLYPHLAEFCLTVQPLLPYAYLVMGVLLEFRPIKDRFWRYLPFVGAIVSFGTMAIANRSEFPQVEPYDLLLNTVLQYVIFYIATFALLSVVMVLFRVSASSLSLYHLLGMRRVSVLSLFLLLGRLHVLGMPKLDFHVNMVLLIFLIALLVTTCEFSPGAFVIYALAAHYMDWSTIEWGLVVMLLDNFVYQTVVALTRGAERKGIKTKRD